jgi:flagellar biosynthesis activator protein FlaF
MLKKAYNDYVAMNQEVLSGRDLEAHVLAKAANKLRLCRSNWGKPDQKNLLDESLKYNQKIWSFFQTELSSAENPMPKELRQNILNLSLFVDKHTINVMAFPDPEKLQVLIDINMNIASGLRGSK